MKAIPRIRGRVAKIEEPKELKDQWCFEISIWTLDGETQIGDPLGPTGPYKTEKEALSEMNRAIRIVCECIEMDTCGEISGKYFDLKNGGVMRPWDIQ